MTRRPLDKVEVSRRRRELALLIAIAGTANIGGLTWGMPNVADWAIDTIVPLGPLGR